jgi:hypothetical protein
MKFQLAQKRANLGSNTTIGESDCQGDFYGDFLWRFFMEETAQRCGLRLTARAIIEL